MNIKALPIVGAHLVTLGTHVDARGKFSRLFCREELAAVLDGETIVQINHSHTRMSGAVRGMHFQYPPAAEIKLVRCLRGQIFDVIVDLRKNSATFLHWHGEILTEDNMKMMVVPKGTAHGFQTLQDDCELLYLHSEYYCPDREGGLRFDDPRVGIAWPEPVSDISMRDAGHPYIGNDFEGVSV